MRLTNLADHLRSWGLTVVEEPGWEARGADFLARPHVVVAHHTGTPQVAKGDYPTLRIVRDGRADLPGPLSQVGLGRSGKVYVIAAGKANHAGRGSWAGLNVGNTDSIGVEAESPGDGSWTPAQRSTYPRVCAALLDLLGSPPGLLCGHKESALPPGRKPDPAGLDMNVMRAQAGVLLANHQKPPPVIEGDDMPVIAKGTGPALYVTDYQTKRHIVDPAELTELERLGLKRVAVTDRLLNRLPEVKL